MSKRNCSGLWRGRVKAIQLGLLAATTVFVCGVCNKAGAVEIPTGIENVDLRWDNTLRYSLSQRVKSQNNTLLGDPNIDDGNRNFGSGIVGNRLDLLSEFDARYNKNHGIRLSGAGWYDFKADGSLDKTFPTSNGFSSYTDRYYVGPDGELLDAFAFTQLTIGEVPVNLKVGRHSVIWGESMFTSGGAQGISNGQSGIDAAKGFALPGVEMKEIFRPLNQVSVQVQPTSELTLGAQYFLQWEETHLPGAGSYLGFADLIWSGGQSLLTPPPPIAMGQVRNGGNITPKQSGDYGLMARWSPSWLEGTVGLYYRDYSAKEGQMHLSPMSHQYNFVFADGIKLYGVSLSQQWFGVSIGAEVNYRTNMPLQSEAALIGPAFIPGAVSATLPGSGETFGARGETFHAVVNTLKLFSKTPLFDTAGFLTEFVWDRWLNVTQGENLFKGRDSYSGIDRVTKDHIAAQVIFNPTWYQVINGVDLTMPLSFSMGLVGTSAIAAEGANKDSGQYGIGLSADIFQKYKVDLTYAAHFGAIATDSHGGVTTNSPHPLLKDRDMLTLTLKTTF